MSGDHTTVARWLPALTSARSTPGMVLSASSIASAHAAHDMPSITTLDSTCPAVPGNVRLKADHAWGSSSGCRSPEKLAGVCADADNPFAVSGRMAQGSTRGRLAACMEPKTNRRHPP